jgi:hypothetical protein
MMVAVIAAPIGARSGSYVIARDVEFGMVSVPLPNTTTGFALPYQATDIGVRSSRDGKPIGMRTKKAPSPSKVGHRQPV